MHALVLTILYPCISYKDIVGKTKISMKFMRIFIPCSYNTSFVSAIEIFSKLLPALSVFVMLPVPVFHKKVNEDLMSVEPEIFQELFILPF